MNYKRSRIVAGFVFVLVIVLSQPYTKWQDKQERKELLAEGFITPADSMQTAVYWYWISDNLSKEGVIKDLYAMKKVGINRAFIGNIGLDEVPYGNVKMFSNEWWDILHTALKTATELNIEIGIFNSPGWSQSGGPWVKAENAMRYLTASKTKVRGPQLISQKLVKPVDVFQDVKVIAYPAPQGEGQTLTTKNAVVYSVPEVKNIDLITDGNNTSGITFPKGNEFSLYFESATSFTARSLLLKTTDNPMYYDVILQAVGESGSYETIKEFTLNRVNDMPNVGFEPYAPLLISFPAISSSKFRILFKEGIAPGWAFPRANLKSGLAEVKLMTTPSVENYAQKTFAKMFHSPLPLWSDYQWKQQEEVIGQEYLVDPARVIDISHFMLVDGTLSWDVPEGEWVIMRMGMTPTGTKNAPASPEATGFEVDKMNKKHIDLHFEGYMGEILKRIPEEDRKCLKVVVLDSYEVGGQNFTDGFVEDFERVYKYDPTPYLPVLQGVVVESQDASDRFLWDLRRIVADKIAYDYVGGLREVSHKNGMTTWLENYGHWGFASEFLMYGGQSDEISGEFWSEGTLGDIENRAASSCGHIYNKKRIWAESHTCGGKAFSRYPALIKQRGDKFFAEGINATLLHVYIHQAYEDKNPGINAGFGNPFNRKNTWFSHIDLYIDYLKRANYMLQQGLNVADVAYFIGEDAPKMTGIADPSLPVGYQYDYINAEVIKNDMRVKDGLLTLPHGTQYRLLVLPKLETMRPELLKKINQLVKDGAVVMGAAPLRSPSLQNQPEADEQVKELASGLWSNVDGINVRYRKHGKGMVINGMSMEEALDLIQCQPDCKLPDNNTIHYNHRVLEYGDIYFLSNQTNEEQIIQPEFRVTGLMPELWDATSGSIRPLASYDQKANTTRVPLKLAPNESVFIVFREKAVNGLTVDIMNNYPKREVMDCFTKAWKVDFDKTKRGPTETVVFNELIDWSRSADERIRYYSGNAFYHNTFTMDNIEKSKRYILDLGGLSAMAKVMINDTYVGGVWTAPYAIDITSHIKDGENNISIEVVNTWVNRIIGDMKLPVEKRHVWAPHLPYNEDSPLQPSGLFGPVNICVE